jgi:hypothetical protein
MKKCILGSLMIGFLLVVTNAFGQAGTSQASVAQSRIVGEVTAVDKAVNQVTIKTDDGATVIIATTPTTSVLRLPPGETSPQNALRITLGDIAKGDRIFAKGTVAGGGIAVVVSQIVVSGGTGSTSPDSATQRGDARNRGLNGRITALNADKKEISVQSRSREGVGTITIQASDLTKFFRYAPDSLDIKNASRSSFAGLKVGDQLRALGETDADGTRFTADEIISGLMGRTGGQVTAVNPAANEITVKNAQTGETMTVTVGSNSMLRRVSAEAAAAFEANRSARQERAERPDPTPSASSTTSQPIRPSERREPIAGEERRPRAGPGIQESLENLPAIKVSDLKKGDTVFVSGTQADPSHMTAIMLLTGDPTFIGRLLQAGPNRGPQNPGLPGDVLGGGVGNTERP